MSCSFSKVQRSGQLDGGFDIALLRALGAAAQHDHEHFAVLKKIHAPARAKMLPHFAHAFADCSHVTQVAVLSFFQPANEARSSRVVTHTVQPSGKLSSAFDDEHGI